MRRKISLCALFARDFAPASLLLTLTCAWLAFKLGAGVFAPLFYFKLASAAAVFFLVDKYRREQYAYYHNLGLSKARLWAPVLAADFLMFIMSVSFCIIAS